METIDTAEIFIKMAKDLGMNPNLSQKEITLMIQRAEAYCALEYGKEVSDFMFRQPVEVDKFGEIIKERWIN